MLFNSHTAFKNGQRFLLGAVLSAALSACTALDEYINPYYNDADWDAAGSTNANSSANSNGDNAAVEQASDSNANGESPEQGTLNDERQVDKVPDSVAAPSLLATAGPNPFLSSASAPGAATTAEYKLALAAMRAEDWPSAERLLETLVIKKPRLSGPRLNLGIAQVNQEKYGLAQSSFEEAIKVNSSNQEAYNQLALLHRKQGRFSEAKNTYLKAISVWPAYAPIRLNFGILNELYIGDLTQALTQYEAYQSLQVAPDRKVRGWIIDLKRRLQVTSS
ncbi:MAG: tetratricopeptide repeat protein [Pseudomonadales bacterium]